MIFGVFCQNLSKKTPQISPKKALEEDFSHSSQKIGIKTNSKVKDVFRNRWIRISR